MVVAGAGDLGIVERVVGGWSGSVREASAVPIYRAFNLLPFSSPLFLLLFWYNWPISTPFSSFFTAPEASAQKIITFLNDYLIMEYLIH